jgi:small subunit ribosomal protein S20
MRTQVRKAEEAISAGDATAAIAVVVKTEATIMRAAQKGILHKNTAARQVSRLTKSAQRLAQANA